MTGKVAKISNASQIFFLNFMRLQLFLLLDFIIILVIIGFSRGESQ